MTFFIKKLNQEFLNDFVIFLLFLYILFIVSAYFLVVFMYNHFIIDELFVD